MSTLTIRNLADPIKRKLQLQAAMNGRSMEAEVREIITDAVNKNEAIGAEPPLTPQERMRLRLESVRGIWRGQGSTESLMGELRGED